MNRSVTGRKRNEIPVFDFGDFPDFPSFTGKAYHEVIGSDLLKCIRQTAFVPDPENTKLSLRGVFFELAGEEINTVSTDQRRLSCQRVKAVPHGGQPAENTANIPLKTLNKFKKAIRKAGKEMPVKIALKTGWSHSSPPAMRLQSRHARFMTGSPCGERSFRKRPTP